MNNTITVDFYKIVIPAGGGDLPAIFNTIAQSSKPVPEFGNPLYELAT